MTSLARKWWIDFAISIGLLLVALGTILPPSNLVMDSIHWFGFLATFWLLVLFEEYRIARLTDRLNSLENKPEGTMRRW